MEELICLVYDEWPIALGDLLREAAEFRANALFVELDGFIEVLGLFLAECLVDAVTLGLHHTIGADVVPGRYGLVLAVFVGPFFVPNPGVPIEAEEFAASTFGDRTKQLSTHTGG